MMEEEKRFKIKKLESYEGQIVSENKNVTQYTFWLGVSALAATSLFISNTLPDPLFPETVNSLLGVVNIGIAIDYLKDLILSISRKTMLESKKEEIETELELLEITGNVNQVEERGMKR